MLVIVNLLSLMVPLAVLAAPVEKHSTPYHIFGPSAFPLDSSPICYRRWRHHGHLTFRLARLDTCPGMSDQPDSAEDKNINCQSGESCLDSRRIPKMVASKWVG